MIQDRFASADTREFRFKFWPYFLASALGTLIFVGPMLWVILFPTFAHHPEKFPLVMAAVLLGLTALNFVLCALFWSVTRLRINSWGLRSFSFWGAPREVPWEQITRVQFRWVLLPYAVIWTTDNQKAWFLLCLQDEASVGKTLAQFAPPAHPLRTFLAQRGWIDS